MDTNSLVYDLKTGEFYKDIAGNVEARFNMSGYSHIHPPPIGVNKKVIEFMKDELGGRIMTRFVPFRPKLYAYKTLFGSEDKKCKEVKMYIVKKTLNFEDYKQCLLAGQKAFRTQLMFQNENHEVHTTEVNKLTFYQDIYPSQHNVEKTNQSDNLACFLDLTFAIEKDGKLSGKLNDKRDDFDCHIVNFPFPYTIWPFLWCLHLEAY